jgi:hypothetical protein
MDMQKLSSLGDYLKANHIEFVIWHQDHSMQVPVVMDDESFDYLCIVWESKFDDHGVATGEFVYKVTHEEYGSIYKSDSPIDTAEFIKNEIENILDDVCC